MSNKKRKSRIFKKEKAKKIAHLEVSSANTSVELEKKPTSHFFRKLLNTRLFLLTLILGGISLAVYLLDDSSPKKFTVILSNFDSVAFKENYRIDHPTSPLCGCLNDSVPHDGIMIPAQYCKIKTQKNGDFLSNFLFTCPDESQIGPVPCFSFDVKLYRFSRPDYQTTSISDLSSIIEYGKDTLKSRAFDNQPFFSIITSNDIEIYSRQSEAIFTFIGAVKGSTSLKKVFDKYEGNISRISIENICDLTHEDSVNKVPAVDFHTQKIYIKWVDSLEALTPQGSTRTIDDITESYASEIKKNPVKQSYKDVMVNVAVIEPKNNIRVSMLPWDNEILKGWEAHYFNQFPDAEHYMFFMNIPIIDRRDLSILDFKDIKPFGTPNVFSRNSDINIEVGDLTEDSTYNRLYEKYTREEGYYYNYDSNDYEIVKVLDFTKDAIDSDKASQILHSSPKNSTDAHLLLKNSKEFLSLFDMSKGKARLKDTINLGGRREYFRYPPLHPEKGISLYTQFSYLKLLSCNAEIQFGKLKTSAANQTLEITDMKDMEYEYPNLFTEITGNVKKVVLKGVGKIKVDGMVIKENPLENKYLLMIGTLATIISFILAILSSFGSKKNMNTKKT